jgi:fibro-slime domain-containing protein
MVGLALPLGAACGSRSSLPVCTAPGEVRSCSNACGAGSQACVDERWTDCVVPLASRACSNACGPGSQTCADGAWGACAVPDAVRACTSACGQGHELCTAGAWQPCDAPLPGPPTITATVRDFDDTHPDFESDASVGLDPGIVAVDLGPDDKPVYASDASTPTTHGAVYFNEWYHDTRDTVSSPDASAAPDINMTTGLSLSLLPDAAPPGMYAYVEDAFFPIDGRLLGNQGRRHDYDFTVELEASFQYMGGEVFTFASDDDSWVFLNRKLAVDLGGVHQTAAGSISLDLASQRLGLVKGMTYPMHLFYAERHVTGAVLHIQVSAADFAVCDAGP